MEEVNLLLEINNAKFKIEFIKLFFIMICSYYTFVKSINKTINVKKKSIDIIEILIISIIGSIIRIYAGDFNEKVFEVIVLTIICAKSINKHIGYAILSVVISMSINYAIYFIAVIISFIPNVLIKIQNDYISLLSILIIHLIILIRLLKIKKFKYGMSFLHEKISSDYADILILNISIIILFATSIFSKAYRVLNRKLFIGIIVFIGTMFITIQKSIQLSYKQKLLEQELKVTKEKLENKTKELEEAEKENIKISKKNHTITHKQKALSHKIEEIIEKIENSQEIGIDINETKRRIENLSKQINEEKVETELSQTDIPEIDDMLKYMQSESRKNNIDFELQIKGNINYMVNNLIDKEDLETLIADHVKNAIIAINHTDNINRSILVKLGKIEEIYSLYIYDSGIEFQKETLEMLGKKPSTTHSDEGGTGMGFMNTFDTLKKYKASLTIKQNGKPSKDDYTKAIIIKFDNKNEYTIK